MVERGSSPNPTNRVLVCHRKGDEALCGGVIAEDQQVVSTLPGTTQWSNVLIRVKHCK